MLDIRKKIAPRLRACREAKGWTYKEVAERLGDVMGKEVGPSRYGNWELAINIPPLDMLIGMSSLFGRPSSWLAALTDDDGTAPEVRSYTVPPVSAIPTPQGLIDIGDDSIALHNNFIERLKVQRSNIALVKAPDDSMSGSLEEGDLALVDLDETSVTRNDMFAIMVNGHLWLRWIRQTLEGEYVIQAEKRDRYPDTTISPEKLADLHILGRLRLIAKIR